MAKNSCCEKKGLKRGAWTPEEDKKLSAYIRRYGHWNWHELPKYAGLSRCGKSCRLRWMNYLRPNIKRGNFSREEDEIIINLHETLGSRWSSIAAKLPGRTDNEIKNHWHSCLKKCLKHNSLVSEDAKFQCAETLKCKANMEKESEANNFLPIAPTPQILESSSLASMSMEKSYLNSDGVTGENLGTNGNIYSSETFVEFDGNFWTEPFLVEDSCFQDHFTSTLSEAELEFPLSPMSLNETLWPDEFLYNGSNMDFFSTT